MTHPFEVRGEVTVDATPEQVWDAITTGPGVDSWLMGRTEIDAANKTSTFDMFGNTSTSAITAWEPGRRYATQEEKNPDGTFMAFEWLIEARDGGGAVVRFVHSGLLGEDWEAEYNGLSVGDQAYLTKLAVYLEHFAPRTAKLSTFLPGPVTKDSWAAMTAAVGAGADAADGQPARLDRARHRAGRRRRGVRRPAELRRHAHRRRDVRADPRVQRHGVRDRALLRRP